MAFRDLECGRVTGAGAHALFERGMPVHQVLHNQLNAEIFQISVRRIVPGVIADREEIEGAIGWLDICGFADRAGERSENASLRLSRLFSSDSCIRPYAGTVCFCEMTFMS
jgi:hypothetical protein